MHANGTARSPTESLRLLSGLSAYLRDLLSSSSHLMATAGPEANLVTGVEGSILIKVDGCPIRWQGQWRRHSHPLPLTITCQG